MLYLVYTEEHTVVEIDWLFAWVLTHINHRPEQALNLSPLL